MFILALSFLCAVSAQTEVFTRLYLRSLKRLEDQRIQADFINRGITYVENSVFTAAKQGLLKYTTQPFEGCGAYRKANSVVEGAPFRLDKDLCENIVNGIHILVSKRFPDSEIIYDANTKQYTLRWD